MIERDIKQISFELGQNINFIFSSEIDKFAKYLVYSCQTLSLNLLNKLVT